MSDAKPSGSEQAGRLRLVVADDHAEVLQEICDLLESEFDVVQAVSGGPELVDAAESTRPNAVVSDISMPGMDGIEACSRILKAGAAKAVVLLTMHDDPQVLERAVEAGIGGFILKVDAGEELIDAVHAVYRGEQYWSRSVRNGRGRPAGV